MDHLARRGGRYYYRRRVPTDLVVALGTKEVMKALGTSDPAEARAKARVWAVQFDAVFAKAAGRRMEAPWSGLHLDEWGRDPWEPADQSETEDDRDARLRAWFVEAMERIVGGQARELLAAIVEGRGAPVAAKAAPPSTGVVREPSISDDSRDWADVIKEWERIRAPAASTVKAGHNAINYLWEACGRISPQQVTRTHLTTFQTHLRESGRATATVRMQVSYIKTFLAIALDMGVVRANPWAGTRTEVGKQDAKIARVPFSSSDLRVVVDQCSQERLPSRKWVPLIGLYTGMRIEEICQLAPADLRQESYKDSTGKRKDVYVFYVTDEGEGQGLKNAASRRRIPVHKELVRRGFIKYAQAQTGTRLFPDLHAQIGSRESAQFSRWFGACLRKRWGITDKRKTFHSFRHTFKDLLREHGVPEDVSDALSGHTNGSVARNYGGAYYPLRPLVEALDKYEIHGL